MGVIIWGWLPRFREPSVSTAILNYSNAGGGAH
jgi:hypothetical protein